jgi:hypothetical protein
MCTLYIYFRYIYIFNDKIQYLYIQKNIRQKKQRPHQNYTNKNKTRTNAKNIRTPHLLTHEKINPNPLKEKDQPQKQDIHQEGLQLI